MFKGIFTNTRGNVLGGITAGIVALPLALAFGVQSGLGPGAGLYGAIMIGFFASLFGGTNTQISGPTAPMTAVSMAVVAAIIAVNDGSLEKAIPYILFVFLLTGVFQIGLGLLGVGKYIKYIPYPVVSGFMTAIGVIILITQTLPVLGYYVEDDKEFAKTFMPQGKEVLLNRILKEESKEGVLVLENFENTVKRAYKLTPSAIEAEAMLLAKAETLGPIGAIKILPRALQSINWMELALALATILIIFGFKRITTKVPSPLVALLVVSLAAYFLQLDYHPIEKIPSTFPVPNMDMFFDIQFSLLAPYIFTALTLAFLGAIDSLLTSVVADNMTKTRHQPNQELIGQGIGNSVAAIFGGIPGAGATIRTVVNINSGSTTKLSGMIASLFLVAVLLLLSPIASQIPAAVLAGILITVGIGVMDYKGLKAIPKMPRSEVVIMGVVLLLAVFWDLVYAVGIGLIIASIIFMKKMGDSISKKSKGVSVSDAVALEETHRFSIPEQFKSEVIVKNIEGPLFFANTSAFQELVTKIPKTTTHLILRFRLVPYMDQSGLYALEDVVLKLQKEGVQVLLVKVLEQPRMIMESVDLVPNLIPNTSIFEKVKDAVDYAVKNRVKNT